MTVKAQPVQFTDPPRLPQPPRDVFRKRGVPVPVRCLLFLLLPHVWAGLFFIVLLIWRPALQWFGNDMNATVVSRTIVRSKRSTSCRIVYTYQEAGRQYKDSASFASSAFTQFPAGSSLPVRSLHVHGYGSSQLRTDVPAKDSYGGLIFFALVWNGIVLLFFYAGCLAPLRERKLLREGEIAAGNVTDKTVQRGKSTSYILTYAFQTKDGEDRSRKTTIRKQDYDSANVGDAAIIFYDPLRPRRSVLYNYSQYSVRGMEL